MAPSKTKEFDEAVLMKMAEPITVYVSRIVSGKRTPVPLPVKEGYQTSGQGYTQNDVREIASVLQELWTQGTLRDGQYEVSATDSQSMAMEWQMIFAENSSPMPQAVAAARAATAQQARDLQAQPASNFGPQVAYPGMPVPQSYPAPLQWGNMRGQQAPYPQPQQPQVPQMQVQSMPWYAPPSVPPAPAPVDREAENRARAAESREMETRNQAEQQRIRFEHAQALAAVQSANEKQIAELRALVTNAQARPSEPSAELQVLKDQLAESKRSNEMTLMMNGFKEMIAATNAATSAQIQALTSMVTAKPTGVDPMVQMIMEANKNQMEALKETTKATLEAIKDNSRNQTSARDMLDIADRMRQSSGVDQLLPKMVETYSGAWAMMKQGMEMVQSMTQGPAGNPLLEGAAKVISELPSIAEKYMKMQRDSAVGETNWRTAQAQAERERASVERDVIRASTGQTLDGVAPPQAPQQAAPQEQASAEVVAATKAAVGVTPINAESADMQLFGPALEHVKGVRAGIVAGLNGDPLGIDTPEKAFAQVAAALDYIQQNNLGDKVKATDLFASGMIGQFAEALFPARLQIPGPFMNSLVQRLQALYEKLRDGVAADAEDEDGDEEEQETSNG
jgi:hypothetical protein